MNLISVCFIGCVVIAISMAQEQKEVRKMYISKSRSKDLASSATGYIYRSDGGSHGSLVHLGGAPASFSSVEHFANKPVQVAHYVNAFQPEQVVAQASEQKEEQEEDNKNGNAKADSDSEKDDYFDEVDKSVDEIDRKTGTFPTAHGEGGKEHERNDKSQKIIVKDEEDDGGYKGGDGGHDGVAGGDGDKSDEGGSGEDTEDDDSNYESGGGSEYENGEHSSKGEKAGKGYKDVEVFAVAEKGAHGVQKHGGNYRAEDGSKSSEYDTAQKYAEHEESGKGYKGGSFKEKSGHKKGSKTTGFHNKLYKDEYKKDHTFYDDADKSGKFNKYGKFSAYHEGEAGGFEKGGHKKSAAEANEYGKEGSHDKGHYEDEGVGHSQKEGNEAYYQDYKDYGEKGGSSNGKEYGYASEGKH